MGLQYNFPVTVVEAKQKEEMEKQPTSSTNEYLSIEGQTLRKIQKRDNDEQEIFLFSHHQYWYFYRQTF